MEFNLETEIITSLDRTHVLLESRILWEMKHPAPIYKRSVLIEVLVNMKDLLIKSEKHLGKRVDFKDEIIINEKLKINDVTDLISNFRDAACHNDSFKRKFGSYVFSFNEMMGKGISIKSDNLNKSNIYDDDIAYNMGSNILFLKRHIERAFSEVEANFKPHLSFLPYS